MTNYKSEPIEPFDLRPKANSNSVSPQVPAGGSGSAKPPNHKNSSPISQDFLTVWERIAVAFVLAILFVMVQFNRSFSGLAVFALLGGVMLRLDSRRRSIAMAPITLASLMLVDQLVRGCSDFAISGNRVATSLPTLDRQTLLLPLFLSACLFYMPNFPTYTGKIVLGMSLLMLVSGLLPCNGYVVVFLTMNYFLFIAIVVGLGIDFAQNGVSLTAHTAAAQK